MKIEGKICEIQVIDGSPTIITHLEPEQVIYFLGMATTIAAGSILKQKKSESLEAEQKTTSEPNAATK